MDYDFTTTDRPASADFVTVPEGTYLCEVAEVRPGTTRHGDERWGLRLVIVEGEFTGRQAAWDGITFSDRGKPRVRMVFGALGLPNDGVVSIEPEDLAGRRAFVRVRPSEYRDPLTGETVRRNEVPYAGYGPVVGTDGRVLAPRAKEEPPF